MTDLFVTDLLVTDLFVTDLFEGLLPSRHSH